MKDRSGDMYQTSDGCASNNRSSKYGLDKQALILTCHQNIINDLPRFVISPGHLSFLHLQQDMLPRGISAEPRCHDDLQWSDQSTICAPQRCCNRRASAQKGSNEERLLQHDKKRSVINHTLMASWYELIICTG